MKTKLPFRHVAIPFVLQTIAWFMPAWPVTRFFLHFKTKGSENADRALLLAKERGVGLLVCPNHISEFDPILVLHGFRPFSRAFPMFYVIYTLSVYKDAALFGWRAFLYGELFFLSWGAHALKAGMKDYAVALEPHVPILESGRPLMLFPEGRFSRDGVIGEAKGGAGYLVQKTRPVVLPVCITGLESMKPGDFWFRRRRAVVTYGEPLMPEELIQEGMNSSSPDDCKKIATAIMDRVRILQQQS